MLKRMFMTILAMGIVCAVFAQGSFSLQGSVVNSKKQPLPFTNCVLLNASDSSFAYGTTSDLDGLFSLTGVNQGDYILRISSIGQENYWRDITIAQNTNLGIIEIADNVALLKAVQITASRPLYSADGEKVFYNVSDDPSVQSGNATDALQNAPGVEVDAEGNIKYRGGAEVTIWINDKPSHLKAEGMKQYLKSLPAGTLQRIEVIAHPSAKYHTHNCVVNIITTAMVKRNELLCIGLNVNNKPQVSPWVDYVWSNEKVRFNAFVSGDYDSYSGKTTSDSRLLAPDSSLSSTINTKGHSSNRTLGGNFGLDFDYNIDTNTLVNIWIWSTLTHDSSHLSSRTMRKEFLTGPGDYFYYEKAYNISTMADAAFGVMLEKKFDTLGGMLFLDYTGTLTHHHSTINDLRSFDSLTTLNFSRQRLSLNPSQWHGITADVTLPYNAKGEVDFGIMASLSSERKNIEETVSSDTDPLRSYNFTNGTYELTFYAGAEHHLGRLTLGTSLSTDNAWYRLQYPTTDSGDVYRYYLTFSPTIHASYSTESMHNFTFSYTRHITPPTAIQLSRFTVYGYDSYTHGNPTLKNSYANNIELGWERYFNHVGSVGISAWHNSMRDHTGTLTDVAYCDQFGRIVSFSQPFNIGTARNSGIGMNATLRPADFMNIRFYANIFDDYYRVQYRPGLWSESEMWCYSLRVNFWAKLWDKLQVFVNAIYRSRTQTLMAETNPYFTTDCGVSTDLFDRRLSLFLNVNDIFNTIRTSGASVNPYNPSTSESTLTSHYVSFGLTWRLGHTEIEHNESTAKKKHVSFPKRK